MAVPAGDQASLLNLRLALCQGLLGSTMQRTKPCPSQIGEVHPIESGRDHWGRPLAIAFQLDPHCWAQRDEGTSTQIQPNLR